MPKARVGVFVARPMGLSLVFPKNAPFCSMPRSRGFQFNRRLTGRGVQRTRTLYFVDLSIEICLDCNASVSFDIGMGVVGDILNLIESMGLGMRKALKRRALKIMERFF